MSDQADKLRELMSRTDCAQSDGHRPISIGGRVASALSTRAGRVSFRPTAMPRAAHHVLATPARVISPMQGQAARPMLGESPRFSRAIAIASGKGGVGKTNIAVNLAVALSQLGLRVCLLDGDLGLANADVLCNLSPHITLDHVISGRFSLSEAMMFGPGGFKLIPGASGVGRLAELSLVQQLFLLEQLMELERDLDVLLIDTSAGIGPMVLLFAAAAGTVLVVTTPEPPAITDAYGMIKAILARSPHARIELAVNMTASEADGRAVFNRIDRVCRTFLSRPIDYAGAIMHDSAVSSAVHQRLPFVIVHSESAAAQAVRILARRIAGMNCAEPIAAATHLNVPDQSGRSHGFFARLAPLLGIRGGIR